MRYLIVNADDFGMSCGVNRGIIEAYLHGIVTSASLMVRWPDARDAAECAAANPGLSVGLHLDLGEWIWAEGERRALYTVVDLHDEAAVQAEVRRQLTHFRELMGRDPTHLDSHQHVHGRPGVERIVVTMAAELRVPLRRATNRIGFCDRFYGQRERGRPAPERISVENLVQILHDIPLGTTELMCHPGYGEGLATPYRDERAIELATLTDARVHAAITAEGIELRSFAEYGAP
jgi:predicted glycoside hydrolase/deacetylase ChbG (UPF0249 family)